MVYIILAFEMVYTDVYSISLSLYIYIFQLQPSNKTSSVRSVHALLIGKADCVARTSEVY